MLDFIELGLNIKRKIKIYISSTHNETNNYASHYSGRETQLILFNEFYNRHVGLLVFTRCVTDTVAG